MILWAKTHSTLIANVAMIARVKNRGVPPRHEGVLQTSLRLSDDSHDRQCSSCGRWVFSLVLAFATTIISEAPDVSRSSVSPCTFLVCSALPAWAGTKEGRV